MKSAQEKSSQNIPTLHEYNLRYLINSGLFPLLQIANLLQAQGKKVFGWDTEWEINWDTKRFKYSGKDLFFK